MKTSVNADDVKNHFLKCFNQGMCPDLPRYPDNKVEQATLFLYSSNIRYAQSAFGLPCSALDNKDLLLNQFEYVLGHKS